MSVRFRNWLLRPLYNPLKRIIDTMSLILDAANKISADIDTKLAANSAALQAANATIADLQGQLAALQANDADTTAALGVIQAADAKLA